MTLYSVIHKARVPPSGDPHDYFTVAPFYWRTKTGWEHRDCQRNPVAMSADYDWTELENFAAAVAVAGDRADGAVLSELVNAWFLDPRTRMTPHLRFAQVKPGDSEGRGTGIVEARKLVLPLRYGALLPHDVRRPLSKWMDAFLNWLDTSPQGHFVRLRTNNIAVWYEAICAQIEEFLGRREALALRADRVVELAAQQIRADGSMPAEARRANPAHYLAFCRQAFAEASRLTGARLPAAVAPEG